VPGAQDAWTGVAKDVGHPSARIVEHHVHQGADRKIDLAAAEAGGRAQRGADEPADAHRGSSQRGG
jgi:hypothetical protein